MPLRIQDNVLGAFLLQEARDDAPSSGGMILVSDLLEKIDDAGTPDWLHVRVMTPGVRGRPEGFLRSIQLREAEQTEPEKINEKTFFRQIAVAAVRLSANQDYLFAVASAVSGLSNTTSEGSSAVGPFRFMPEIWNELVKFNGEENDITADDITDPGAQTVFAAILSVDAQNKLNDSLGRTPTIAQLYIAHLFGIEAAASILGGNHQIQIEKALRDFYGSRPGGAELADKIIKSNLALVTDKTVEQVLDAVVDPLTAGLKRAAALATELGLEPQVPVSPAFGNNLQTALRTAVRRHEIGDDTPYKLSFAEKGRSGASFGFMQGDLGQNQQEVKDAFRRALAAADLPEEKISSLMQTLSVPVERNPLNAVDNNLVNNALDAPKGRPLVDAMDEQILADVCLKLDKCLDAASSSGRTITPEAQIYMLLWINMTGPPTDLLHWLSGSTVRSVPAPGTSVDSRAIQEYLKASKYFTENPGNFQHMFESVAAGARLLTDTPFASLPANTPSAGTVRLTAGPDVDLEETEAIKQLVAIVG
jgi:hypothetical protein